MGKSDFSGSGKITGYLGFALGKEETLAGKMDFKSKFIDLNAFMTDTGETVPEDTTSFSVIPVPANINLIFNAEADRIQFMDFNLTEAMGTVQLREGIARLTGVKFNLLDGAFAMTGTYDPRNLQRPLYDFDMGIDPDQATQWFQDQCKVNQNVSRTIELMAMNDAGYMSSSIKRLQTHNDVKKIVCVTHTVPNSSLIAHDIGLADTLRFNTMGNSLMMQALAADTEIGRAHV